MTQIKKTKSVEMIYNENSKKIFVELFDGNDHFVIWIPLSKVFQVKRGLETAVQRFYRKNESKNRKG